MRSVDNWVTPRLTRRARQEKHPVDDFLFEYYPFSAAKLRTWHPGFTNALQADSDDFEEFDPDVYSFDNGTIRLSPSWISQRTQTIANSLTLLSATHNRPAKTGCFGLHEWAMVLNQDTIRHSDFQLRLSQTEIAHTIDEVGLRCTHFDAFRFFTADARPLNPVQLTRNDQVAFEQPGCLHANMDLYKHAMLLAPLVGSELVRECFQLAKDIRLVDMQVAPYELSAIGVQPIRVETQTGRQEYAEKQRSFTSRAHTLRTSLIAHCEATR